MSFRCGIVSILGRPNAGKSTLLNALIGEKIAAVSDKPQTTRQPIRGIHHDKNYQMIFLDTPGYHHVDKPLNQWMLEQAKQAIADADVNVLLVSAETGWKQVDRNIFELMKKNGQPIIIALNKVDAVSKPDILPMMGKIHEQTGDENVFLVSATQEQGLAELHQTLAEHLPAGPALYPKEYPTDQSMRQLAAEIIREQIFRTTRQEIPYSTAVQIEIYEDPKSPKQATKIGAVILVERMSQKGIVIGKGGAALKKIGMDARKELEKIIQGKVFLNLFVKVAKDWSDNPRKLKELGYK